MAKVSRTFRIDDFIDERLERIAKFESERFAVETGIFRKVTKTDILEMLINRHFSELEKDGYDL